eukprot:s14698_g1.t1
MAIQLGELLTNTKGGKTAKRVPVCLEPEETAVAQLQEIEQQVVELLSQQSLRDSKIFGKGLVPHEDPGDLASRSCKLKVELRRLMLPSWGILMEVTDLQLMEVAPPPEPSVSLALRNLRQLPAHAEAVGIVADEAQGLLGVLLEVGGLVEARVALRAGVRAHVLGHWNGFSPRCTALRCTALRWARMTPGREKTLAHWGHVLPVMAYGIDAFNPALVAREAPTYRWRSSKCGLVVSHRCTRPCRVRPWQLA